MDSWTEAAIAFIERHQEWSFWLALVFAAAETTAFLSIAVPSTAILVGVGAMVATGAVPFFPIWAGAALGAVIGSTFSYWLGLRFGGRILGMWPLRDHPDLVEQASDAFRKWGVGAVFLGHFFGPLRPVIFLFAGMTRMAFPLFFAVNVVAALAWAYVIPKFGEIGGIIIGWFWNLLGF
jgi:membrane protein DedA with SNARE-associated domain